jgi:hypothetical protein
MRPTKIYPFTIPANGAFPLLASGDFFKVLSASGTFEVIGDQFGQLGALQPGQGLRDTEFNRLTFRDTSGAANNLRVLVADGAFIDDRITGEVSVLDGGKARTLSNSAFLLVSNLGPSVGMDCIAGLWNPANSGSNLIIEQVTATVSVDSTVYFGGHRTKLFTGVGGVGSKYFPFVGQGASKAQSDYGNLNAPAIDCVWLAPSIKASVPFIWSLREPIVIGPGVGFYIDARTQNCGLNAGIEFTEELIA